jgi:Flp pilus assembly protein CpaB
MRKRTLISALIGLAALIGALLVARGVARQVQAQVISAPVVVARRVIPPYTLITADLLTVREFPRAITSAPIYREPQELVGLVARVEIVPDVPIFRSYAVLPQAARFSANAEAVAVALKVDTPRAVGGLVTPGQRVDVWRIAKAQPPRDLDAQTLLALRGAGVELVARDLRVLAVRAGQGGPVVPPPAFGLAGSEGEPPPTSSPAAGNISVVTVEVSQALAPALVRLMGELGNVYDLWLTLSPLVRDAAALALAPVYTPEGETVDQAALLLALTPAPTPTPSPTPTAAPPVPPTPWPTAAPTRAPSVVVKPGQATGLNVRAGPGLEYAVLGRVVGGDQLAPVGRDESQQWLLVCCVDGGGDGVRDDLGWVWTELVDVQGVDVNHLPPRVAPPKPPPTPRSQAAAPGMDFQAQVEYRHAPGDKQLNYVRARAVAADGAGLPAGLTFAWPGGAVRCPGDRAPKGDGWCEFIATVGEFSLALDGRAQPVTVTLPQGEQHTVALVVFRRLW